MAAVRKRRLREILPGYIYPTPDTPLKIRLGPGTEEGFVKIGPETEAPDHVVDTRAFPWPIEDGLVDQVYAAFYFHRLDKPARWAFMDECWRVLKPGGQLVMVMPHWSSMRAIADPLAEWPPVCESSFMLYSKKWREAEKMADLPLKCDFGDVYGYGHSINPEFNGRNDEFLNNAKAHWLNAAMDLHVTLTK